MMRLRGLLFNADLLLLFAAGMSFSGMVLLLALRFRLSLLNARIFVLARVLVRRLTRSMGTAEIAVLCGQGFLKGSSEMGNNIRNGLIAAMIISLLFGGTLAATIVYFLIKKASC